MQIIAKLYPHVLKQLGKTEEASKFEVKMGKMNHPYIEGVYENQPIKIHSAYNPEREAEALLAKYEDKIKDYEYVIFLGAGLGYHISLFRKKYPKKIIYVYEPSKAIFSIYLNYANLDGITQIFVGSAEENLDLFGEWVFKKKILWISFPAYETLFAEELEKIREKQKEFLEDRKDHYAVTAHFERRWILNALYNYPHIIDTPSVLHKAFKNHFENKPVLIVSAGPSLNDEIENLRKIKEQKTAYIFTVGSAMNALLSKGITPDATCSYDPSEGNLKVYQKILLTNNDRIPLIFSSTFMTEIVKQYPGKKAHFILSKDEINPVLLDIPANEIISDVPTVAAVLLQILLRWKTKTIIFVGQNLAFRGKEQYAAGISYTQKLNYIERPKDSLISVESVTGGSVYTSDTYQSMKSALESLISVFKPSDIDVINTTVDGAHIKGTTFMPLSDVMEQRLNECVVSENWFDEVVSNISKPDMEKQQKKYVRLRQEFLHARHEMDKQIRRVDRILLSMEKNVRLSRLKPTIKDSDKYEKTMQQIEKNLYYRTLLVPFLTIYLVQQNAKLVELRQKILPEMEHYTIKYSIIKEAVDTIINVYNMINHDVDQILNVDIEYTEGEA